MTTGKLRIADIRYNPEHGGFEALVSVHDGGIAYHYPTFTAAPLTASFSLIAKALTDEATRAHQSTRPGLRMHLRALTGDRAPRRETGNDSPMAA